MMREGRTRRLPMALSALVALALAVLPLPNVLDVLRPDFLVLVVFYWSIASPSAGGLALPFFAGLALDVIKGVVLGLENGRETRLNAREALHPTGRWPNTSDLIAQFRSTRAKTVAFANQTDAALRDHFFAHIAFGDLDCYQWLVVLGQHALALTLMAAWATHLRLRLRVFSVLSQSLTIFALLTGYQFVLFWVDGATGNPVTTFSRWLAPVIGAVIWPFLAETLSRLHER